MKKVLIFAFLLGIPLYLQAQEEFKLYKKEVKNTKSFFREQRERIGNFHFKVELLDTQFINPAFEGLIRDGIIEGGDASGYSFSLAYIHHPLIFKIGSIHHEWSITKELGEHYTAIAKGHNIVLNSYYASLDFLVLPNIGKINNYFYPYIGVGCQSIALENWLKDKGSDTYYAFMNTYGEIGAYIRVIKRLFLVWEYHQSLTLSNEKALSQHMIGLSVKF